jgi:hypothetical protein
VKAIRGIREWRFSAHFAETIRSLHLDSSTADEESGFLGCNTV